jgi:hypothetical protein
MPTRSRRRATAKPASFHVPAKRRLSFLPGQIAVKFKPEVMQQSASPAAAGRLRGAMRAGPSMPGDSGQLIDWLTHNVGLKEIRAPFVDVTVSAAGAAGRSALGGPTRGLRRVAAGHPSASANALLSVAASPHEDLRGYTIAHVDPRVDVAKAAKKIEAATAVEFASPVAARWMLDRAAPVAFRLHGKPQWALDCIGFREVAAPRRGKIRIAVLDTGIDLRHPDLKGVDIRYDHGEMRPEDLEGHGTHVSGIISAIAARKHGSVGIAQCDLDVWKVFDDQKFRGERYVDSEMYNRALGLALDGGCSVVNLSLGGEELDEVEKRLIARLIRRRVAVVAAMGNEYEEGDPIEYPAALPGVIAVGGIDKNHERASFSNTGKHICVVAPAVGIRSTIPTARGSAKARYAAWDGTSFAAPQVAGAIGYLLSRRVMRNASPQQIRSMLAVKAVRLPGMRGKSFTKEFGHGLLDLPRLIGRSVKQLGARARHSVSHTHRRAGRSP